MNHSQTDLVTLDKYCKVSGLTVNSVRALIKKGRIIINRHFYKAPNGRIFISIKSMELWVKGRGA